MRVLLVAPHKRRGVLLRYLREKALYTVTTVGSWDGAKKFLGQQEEVIIFTPEVADDILREFSLLKNASQAKTLFLTDWPYDKRIWRLLTVGLDSYCLLNLDKLEIVLNKVQNNYIFLD